MFHEGVAPALLLCVFHSPLNKLRRLLIIVHPLWTPVGTEYILLDTFTFGLMRVSNGELNLRKDLVWDTWYIFRLSM